VTFDEHTPLIEIWKAYPWLSERMPQIDKRFAVMNTPVGKALMKKNSLSDVSKLTGFSCEKLLNKLQNEIDAHENRDS